jgi:hypothetical protein
VKDKSKRKVIVIVLVAITIAVVFGVFLTAYCICKRTNFRGNITFSDPLWKRYCMINFLIELIETYIAANKMMNKESYDVYSFGLNKKSWKGRKFL